MPVEAKSCINCAYLLQSESAETGLRCGIGYFSAPPLQRKGQNMRDFTQVHPSGTCDKWAQHSPSILRDRFR